VRVFSERGTDMLIWSLLILYPLMAQEAFHMLMDDLLVSESVMLAVFNYNHFYYEVNTLQWIGEFMSRRTVALLSSMGRSLTTGW